MYFCPFEIEERKFRRERKEASIYLDKLLLKPKSFGSFPDNPVFSPSLLNFSVGGGKNSSNVWGKIFLARCGCKFWLFCDLRRNQKQFSNILEASWLDWGFEVTSAIFVRCPARLSSKIVPIYVLFVCKISSPKIWSEKSGNLTWLYNLSPKDINR